MGKFKEKAKERMTNSFVMVGKEKISIEEIIAKYPDGITITAFDILTGKDGSYPAFNFKEDETKFFFGGTVLMDIASDWIKDYDTTLDASTALAIENGVKFRLFPAKSKTGRTYTNVELI